MRGIVWNDGWRFTLEQPPSPHETDIDDSGWENVRIPHDWSIASGYSEEAEACTGYLPGGLGWYRKTFVTSEDMCQKTVFINFDGIYNRASIYCNGELVTFHPYGYSPCLVELTDYLNPCGEKNAIAVRVDHTRYADSRWYTGSGIYRKVSLYILPKVRIPVWGVKLTPVVKGDQSAVIHCNVQLENTTAFESTAKVKVILTDPCGKRLYEKKYKKMIAAGYREELDAELTVEEPKFWDIHEGNLYSVRIEAKVQGEVQVMEERTGIRYFHFDADKGFFLNGRSRKIKGVCLHHEAGLAGAAVPLDMWKRRLLALRECGCNAIRTAHNPASEDFLDLCDEMGFLVQEEFFDEWDNPKDKRKNGTEKTVDYITRGYTEFFKAYAQQDLQNVIRRDYNHPGIFQWSIGNEIEWTYPKYNQATGYFNADASGNYFWTLPPYSKEQIREKIARLPRDMYDVNKTAHRLSKWVKDMDTTRPVVANCILPSASYESGYTDALDIVGYSYRQVVYEYGHKNYPDKPIMGTENLGQWHEWKHVLEKEYIPGIFLWTGIDYIGEAQSCGWPQKAMKNGLLDLNGNPRASYHMFRSLWREDPYIHIVTQKVSDSLYKLDENGNLAEKEEGSWKRRLWRWHEVNEHWNYTEQEMTVIEVYSNCEEVALYLNDRHLGTHRLDEFEDHIYKWAVPYEAGTLRAVGVTGVKSVEAQCSTTGSFEKLILHADKKNLQADIDSAIHLELLLTDEKGQRIRTQEAEVEFVVEGPAIIIGTDNGDNSNVQNHKNLKLMTYQGLAMLVVQGKEKGRIGIYAKSGNTRSDAIEIQVN